MKSKRFVLNLISLSIIAFVVFSCVPQTKIKYLQDKSDTVHVTEFYNVSQEYKIKPGDYLDIRVLTLDEKSNALFSAVSSSEGSATGSDQSSYLSGYMVNDSGYFKFPLLGKINASGLSIREIEIDLNARVSELLSEAHVIVKLVLFNISILGEVKSPGKYPIYKDKVNIFEAISLAGDLTTFANRSNIQIIRNNGNKNSIETINVLSKDILTSPYYYLQPNDIIYVEPLKSKVYAFETFPYALVFSTIGLLLVIGSYFK
jgi:polysaccharide export outer membrane protein